MFSFTPPPPPHPPTSTRSCVLRTLLVGLQGHKSKAKGRKEEREKRKNERKKRREKEKKKREKEIKEASYFYQINMTGNRLEYDRKIITPTMELDQKITPTNMNMTEISMKMTEILKWLEFIRMKDFFWGLFRAN